MRIKQLAKLAQVAITESASTPVQLIHFVTSRCNARCGFCFYWNELNKVTGELTLQEIEKTTRSLPDLLYLCLSGGEPFVRTDLPEIVELYYKNTPVAQCTIPSNGSLTEKTIRDCERILKNCPEMKLVLAISLDGFPEYHDDQRKITNCFEKAVETFRRAKELQKSYKNLQLSIICTMTSGNQERVNEFAAHIKSLLNPDVFTLNLIRGSPKEAKLKDIDISYYKEFYQNLDDGERGRSARLRVRDKMNKLRTDMIIKTVETNEYQIPCRAGLIDAVLYENGDVFPCEILNKKIGNLREANYDFRELWKSGKAKEVRSFIKDTKCFCTHECFLRTSILLNKKETAKMLVS